MSIIKSITFRHNHRDVTYITHNILDYRPVIRHKLRKTRDKIIDYITVFLIQSKLFNLVFIWCNTPVQFYIKKILLKKRKTWKSCVVPGHININIVLFNSLGLIIILTKYIIIITPSRLETRNRTAVAYCSGRARAPTQIPASNGACGHCVRRPIPTTELVWVCWLQDCVIFFTILATYIYTKRCGYVRTIGSTTGISTYIEKSLRVVCKLTLPSSSASSEMVGIAKMLRLSLSRF